MGLDMGLGLGLEGAAAEEQWESALSASKKEKGKG